MSVKCEKLFSLINEFEAAGVLFERMDSTDLEKIKEISNENGSIFWLVDHTRLVSKFMNDAGINYFGLESKDMSNFSFGSFMEMIHPDDLHYIKSILSHFNNHPKEVNCICVRMKNSNGEWKWVYIAQKALSYSISGLPEVMISMITDIEQLMDNSFRGGSRTIQLEKRSLYETLTQRERQVLDLVASEMTSQEIAGRLFIEPSTVDTHRKHIIRKLKVKSSLGLVQYALFYSGLNLQMRKAQ